MNVAAGFVLPRDTGSWADWLSVSNVTAPALWQGMGCPCCVLWMTTASEEVSAFSVREGNVSVWTLFYVVRITKPELQMDTF